MSGSMPRRVQEEARRYLECGQLRFGFLEVRCEECRRLELVAFSCKGRGWCPSCTTRRSIETGAHVEATLPCVAHRQWTLSLPRALMLSALKELSDGRGLRRRRDADDRPKRSRLGARRFGAGSFTVPGTISG